MGTQLSSAVSNTTMPVAFGFSIGDFLTAISAFKDICDALRKNGGAATAYQEAVTWLNGVHATLKSLESLPNLTLHEPGSDEVSNGLDSLVKNAKACLNRVNEFNNKLKKYDLALGAAAPNDWKKGAWSKVNWALHFSKEFEDARADIGGYTLSVTVAFAYLLFLQNLQGNASQKSLKVSLSSELSNLSSKIDSNHPALVSQTATILTQLNAMAVKITDLEDLQHNYHGKLDQTMTLVNSGMRNPLKELISKIDLLLESKQHVCENSITFATDTREPQLSAPISAGESSNENLQLTAAELHKILQRYPNASGLRWGSSIVDLMNLLKLDSSSFARVQLAEELGVNVGPPRSSEQNTALHKALMRELSQNGGVVPERIRELVGK